MRIALARLLLGRPGLLLLDEPTNHLDLDARNWLEEYLSDYPHAVILVSHDRFFLDAVVTRITEIGMRTLTDYVGNYSAYIKERDARMERLRQQKRDQDEEIERMQAFINRFRYQATKASQVQSRIKMLDKIVRIEIPPERKRVRFHFPQTQKSGRMVMELKHVRQGLRDDARVRRRQPAHRARRPHRAHRPQRRRQVDADADAVGRGGARHRRARRRAPDGDAVLRAGRSGEAGSDADRLPDARRRLADPDGAAHPHDPRRLPVLGGRHREAGAACCRAASARAWRSRACCCGPANTLLLDEPTNHLDLDSKDVLLDALEDFGGTLIFVSHDRYFVDKLATKIIEIGHGDASVYPGTYEEFLWSKKQRAASRAMADAGAMAEAPRREGADGRKRARARQVRPDRPDRTIGHRSLGHGGAEGAGRPTKKRRKRTQRHRRVKKEAEARQRRIQELEARIAKAESGIKELEAQMSAPGFYENHETSKPVIDRHQALMWEVGDLMNKWEALAGTDRSVIFDRFCRARPQPDPRKLLRIPPFSVSPQGTPFAPWTSLQCCHPT